MPLLGECLIGTFILGEGEPCQTGLIMLTPDLGWGDKDAMFNQAKNPSLLQLLLSDMEPTELPISRSKGPYTLVFEYLGVKYRVPPAIGRQLKPKGRFYYCIDDEPVSWFMFIPNAPPVEDEVSGSSPKMLN